MDNDNNSSTNTNGILVNIVRWFFGVVLTAFFLQAALEENGQKYWIGVVVGISILPPVRSLLTRLPKWVVVGLYALLLILFAIFVLL